MWPLIRILSLIARGMPQRRGALSPSSSIRFCAARMAVSSASNNSRYAFSSPFLSFAVDAHASHNSRTLHSPARSIRAASVIVSSFRLVMREYLLNRQIITVTLRELLNNFFCVDTRCVWLTISTKYVSYHRKHSLTCS